MSTGLRAARVLALLGCAACAPALREPPPLEGLAGAREAERSDPAALVAEARRLWQERSLGSVRRAVALWLRAAPAVDAPAEALAGAIRASIWLAGEEPDPEARRQAARAAVHAGQWCERIEPEQPRCSYLLALALGVQARERRTTALDALPRIVHRLEALIERAPELDHGGPHRVLALVRLRAPEWPAGPGDAELGLEQALGAVRIAPAYPPNQLCLGEALAATGDRAGAIRAYEDARARARDALARGDPDAPSWIEEAERGLARERAEGASGPALE